MKHRILFLFCLVGLLSCNKRLSPLKGNYYVEKISAFQTITHKNKDGNIDYFCGFSLDYNINQPITGIEYIHKEGIKVSTDTGETFFTIKDTSLINSIKCDRIFEIKIVKPSEMNNNIVSFIKSRLSIPAKNCDDDCLPGACGAVGVSFSSKKPKASYTINVSSDPKHYYVCLKKLDYFYPVFIGKKCCR